MSSEEKQYTLAEVAKHNSNLSTWIVIHNNVYDVTQYLIEHPGGEEVLLEQAGKDGSEPFEDATHSTDSRELMVKYKIGEIVEAERKPVKAICSEEYQESQRYLKYWMIPVALGVLVTVVYRCTVGKIGSVSAQN